MSATTVTTTVTATATVAVRPFLDDRNRQKAELSFDQSNEASRRLAAGVKVVLERSEFDSHQMTAAEMATNPATVVLNRSAVKLVHEALIAASNPDADVQVFTAQITDVLGRFEAEKLERQAAKEAAKTVKKPTNAVLTRQIAALTTMLAAAGVDNETIDQALANA